MHSGRNDSMEDDGATSWGASTIFPELLPALEDTPAFSCVAPSASVSMGTGAEDLIGYRSKQRSVVGT
jgi:hypothetical protein